MPTTIVGASLRMMVRPMSAGSAPKRRFQSPSPIMTTGAAPGRSSSSVNARPANRRNAQSVSQVELAAMAKAIVNTTEAVNKGVRRIMRPA